MTLNMMGIGLADEKDITLKGLELVQKSDMIYLENYTSTLQCDKAALEEYYGAEIILADRDMVENKTEIIDNARDKEVSFLVVGDVFGATTHVDLLTRAKEQKIKVNIVHNTSILTAVGETGLELYKFGKTTSIPFDNENVVAPVDVLTNNQNIGLHTLFLLDLNPKENKYMTIKEAINYLLNHDVDGSKLAVACCAMGSEKQIIKAGTLEELKEEKFDSFPCSLIIPGKLHFVEEEMVETYK